MSGFGVPKIDLLTEIQEVHVHAVVFPCCLACRLEMRLKVFCNENFYGPDCTLYCRPQDDATGHYSCTENGKKICLPGKPRRHRSGNGRDLSS